MIGQRVPAGLWLAVRGPYYFDCPRYCMMQHRNSAAASRLTCIAHSLPIYQSDTLGDTECFLGRMYWRN
jgi:hypothetical protein